MDSKGNGHSSEYGAALLVICTFTAASNVLQRIPIFYRLACGTPNVFQDLLTDFNGYQLDEPATHRGQQLSRGSGT
jgi:hypothetical protein